MAEVNSRRESRASERDFEPPAAARGEQPSAKNGGIPGLQRADRRTESGFADVVLADVEDSNSRYPMGPKLDAIGRGGRSVGK